MTPPLLSVENLSIAMAGAPVVEAVSFALDPGEMLGLVGESGCGKTVTALSLLQLVPHPPGRITGGRVLFRGRDLLALDGDELRRLRGDRIGMIFQEPMTSLNPVFTIGAQIEEAVLLHRAVGRAAARRRALDLLDLVGIPAPHRALDRYPSPALRRAAPARHDRDRACQRARPPRGRRAHDGA
jgi:ABC-type microcin C transport system duplicated ATPase subunit YejF